jgi:NAD(P)-dependent dehydrogenase (short-subunit alcohol dehydrogenase family)
MSTGQVNRIVERDLSPDGKLAGRRAIVTGGTSGIGEAVAKVLSREGAQVLIVGRSRERGLLALERLGNPASTHFVAADLTSQHDRSTVLQEVMRLLGGIDILVNNAGAFSGGLTSTTSEHDFDELVALDLRSVYFLTQLAIPQLQRGVSASIINVSTAATARPEPESTLYSALKASIDVLTRGWAVELGPTGVRVNAVAPGMIVTPAQFGGNFDHVLAQEMRDTRGKRLPAGRPGEASEVAEVVAFLASDAASFVHGVVVPVDGGFSAGQSPRRPNIRPTLDQSQPTNSNTSE